MSLSDIIFSKNDSLPSIQFTVTRSGDNSTTPNLTNYTASLKVRKKGNSTNTFTISVTSSGGINGQITSPASGVIRFDWTTSRWTSTGTYIGEISFQSSAGKTETCPDRQTFRISGEY